MKKLCLDDEYLTEFNSNVTECFSNDDGTFSVILRNSYFYPESGGQTGDHGFIGDAAVMDVQISGEEMVHITDKAVEGKNIKCIVDWKRRLDHMQQHTGQHMLSGIIEDRFGIKTLSFHMGEMDSSIETDVRMMDEKRIDEIETIVNGMIFRNIEIKKYFTENEVEGVRKKVNISGPKRVVEIKGVDISYCGGTHVNRTGEVGIFKITGIDKVRKNIRLHFKCGYRALDDYKKDFAIVAKLKKLLTRDGNSVIEGVESLIEHEKKLQKRLKVYRTRELEDFLNDVKGVFYEDKLEGFSDEEIRYIQAGLIGRGIESIILNLNTEKLFVAVREKRNDEVRSIAEDIKKRFGAKGGGNGGRFQFTVGDRGQEVYSYLIEVIKP